jgi:hypothetical protein
MSKSKTDNNFVRSGRERIADDNYQTIDPRCTQALVETLKLPGNITIADCCSPSGSGILDYFEGTNVKVKTCDDAFTDFLDCDWVIFNPPYARNVVDKIIYRQIQRLVDGDARLGVAALLRTSFDHAKTRQPMFRNNPLYAGQLKMLFRPIWFTDGDSTPIHNYSWMLWSKNWNKSPQVWYW